MKVPFVSFKKQYQGVKEDVWRGVKGVLASGCYISGPKVAEFEKGFAKYCGARYALGVNNGTSALLLALLALGVEKGDEVITVPNTFVATVEAIIFAGAKPVFVDINPKTYNIDHDKIEKAITKRTKVILPVHLFGQPANMDLILKIARKHNLFVVEDTAQAHGAMYKGKKAGALGDIGCFSFYPTKVLGAFGEAGAVVTQNKRLAERMRMIKDHGSVKKYQHSEIGFNFRMEEIQGAILALKLRRLNQWIRLRRDKAGIYNKLLKDVPVVIPSELGFSKSSYYVYVIRTKDRESLQKYLANNGIATMIHYPLPIHLQPGYRFLGYKNGDFPAAEKAAKEILSLPFYPEIEMREQKYVVKKIKEFYAS